MMKIYFSFLICLHEFVKLNSESTDCRKNGKSIGLGSTHVSFSEECELCECKNGRLLTCIVYTECLRLDCKNDNKDIKECCRKNKCVIDLEKPKNETNVLTLGNFMWLICIVLGITIIIMLIIFLFKIFCIRSRPRQVRRQSFDTISSRVSSRVR